MHRQSKVLVIGWDAADWKVINPLLDSGQMPNLARLVESGASGNIATIEPILSPMLWTSIATGKRAHKHGILGFSEVDPTSGKIRPVTTLGRKTKAIWNILSQEGKRCHVVGWWPSHPAEPINGVMVSNHFHTAHKPLEEPWPVPDNAVHPDRLREPLAALRFHPQELTHEHIGPFVPHWQEALNDAHRPLDILGKILAECTTVHSAATAIMQLEPWDFMAIYFDAIDHFSHAFMRFHPPRNPWIPEKEFEWFKDVISGAYRYHDMMLGTLLSLAGPDTTVILLSDHGFHPDQHRLRSIPREPAGPAAEHRPFGILVAHGPGIRKDERVYGASLLDIAPTILTILGLPIGEDMDGKPLVSIFTAPPAITSIPSWDTVAGADGSHPKGALFDSLLGPEALKQLVDLGYIADPGQDQAKAREKTTTELRYNLARSYIGARDYASAEPLLDTLYRAHPDQHRFGVQLAFCYKTLRKPAELKQLVEQIISRRLEEASQATAEIENWRSLRPEIATPDELEPKERYRLQQLKIKSRPNTFAIEYLLGCAEQALGNPAQALTHLERARQLAGTRSGIHNQLAEVYLQLRRWDQAENCFQQEIENDPENATAHLGLSRCLLRRGELYSAIKEALTSVGLIYFNPYGHYLLGVSLQRFGSHTDAEKAFKVALAQQPAYRAAHRALSRLYSKFLNNPEKAAEHRRTALDLAKRIPSKTAPAIRSSPGLSPRVPITAPLVFPAVPASEWITIVSGLPRSGTSLMMQMLAAGGLPALTDAIRQPDEDNPLGYLEFEAAKNLHHDTSWLDQAKGKVVKVVAQLLPFLPPGKAYRVILMDRHMDEVLASQAKMLARNNRPGANANLATLAETFSLQWRQTHEFLIRLGIPHLVIRYQDCLRSPGSTVHNLCAFLDQLDLNRAAMQNAVRPDLHRNKAAITP